MKYYLYITKDCEPKLLQFDTDKERERYAIKFLKENQTDDSNNIEFSFKGELGFVDKIIPVLKKKKKKKTSCCSNLNHSDSVLRQTKDIPDLEEY